MASGRQGGAGNGTGSPLHSTNIVELSVCSGPVSFGRRALLRGGWLKLGEIRDGAGVPVRHWSGARADPPQPGQDARAAPGGPLEGWAVGGNAGAWAGEGRRSLFLFP